MTPGIDRLQDGSLTKAVRAASGERACVTARSGPDLGAIRAACAPGVAAPAGLFRRRSGL